MLVLAKALGKKFAHQAGYALINGRWKKTTPDMKGIKYAPKAAHPKAGGTGHKPYTMPEEDVPKLLYAPEKAAKNDEMKKFNEKQVPGLLAHASKGDIAAILGSSYGTNTHAKKLVAIANYLLEQMGSKEKVSLGQKAGEHPAIATYEREPETVEQMAEQAVEAVAQEAKAATKPAKGNLTAKQQAIVSGIESYLGLPPIEAYKVKNNVITIEIGDLKQHQLHAIENYGTQFGYFKTEPGGAKKLSLIMPKDGPSPSPEKKNAAKEEVQKASTPAAEDAVEKMVEEVKPDASEAPTAGSEVPHGEYKDSGLTMPEFKGSSAGTITAFKMKAQEIIDLANDGNMLGLDAIATGPGFDGKSPNSKKLLNLYAQAVAKATELSGGVSKREAPDVPSPAAAVITVATSIAQPDTADGEPAPSPSDAAAKINAVDWTEFYVAEKIPNHKSYNAKIDSIAAMAAAGNINGILGLTYGINTHNKKVAKAANHALATLGYPDLKVVLGKDAVHPMLGKFSPAEKQQKEISAAAQKIKAAADAGPKEGDTRQGKNGLQKLVNGHWVNVETGVPVPESKAAFKPKKGALVSPHDMKSLPAGTTVQLFDQNGHPYLKVMLGDGLAWAYGPGGKLSNTPMMGKKYKELMGMGDKTPDRLGFVSAYHHPDHPAKIVSVGKPDFTSDDQKSTIKKMYPGILSVTPKAGIYPIGDGLVIMGDPAYPTQGVWVNQLGDYGHVSAITPGSYDVYDQFMSGTVPALNIAESLGLHDNIGVKVDQPPVTGNEQFDATAQQIMADIEAGDWDKVQTEILDLVDTIAAEADPDGMKDAMAMADWLVAAMKKAKGEAGNASVQDLQPPAPQKAPRAATPPAPELPEFADVKAFDEWYENNGYKFEYDNEVYHGGTKAASKSPAAKALKKWKEISEATKASKHEQRVHELKQASGKDEGFAKLATSAYNAIKDAGGEQETAEAAANWVIDAGAGPLAQLAVADAMMKGEIEWLDLADDYFDIGMQDYPGWWTETYPGMPMKPMFSPVKYGDEKAEISAALSNVHAALKSGVDADPDKLYAAIGDAVKYSDVLDGDDKGAVMDYLADASAWMTKNGPQEGDTKPGKGGTLVFHNGHWILQNEMPTGNVNKGFTDQDVSNLAQTVADLEGDEAYEIIEDWVAKSGKTKEAYEAAISTYASAKPNETLGLGKIGSDYLKKYGSVTPEMEIPSGIGMFEPEAKLYQGMAAVAQATGNPAIAGAMHFAIATEADQLPGKTAQGKVYKDYLTTLAGIAEKSIHQKSAPKPKELWQDMQEAIAGYKNPTSVLKTLKEHIDADGSSVNSYKAAFKALADLPHFSGPAIQLAKQYINNIGVPPAVPKYSGVPVENEGQADQIDSLTAAGVVAELSDSPTLKAAVKKQMDDLAYYLDGMNGFDSASIHKYAAQVGMFIDGMSKIEIAEAYEATEALAKKQAGNVPDIAKPKKEGQDLTDAKDMFAGAIAEISLLGGDDNEMALDAELTAKEFLMEVGITPDAIATVEYQLGVNDFEESLKNVKAWISDKLKPQADKPKPKVVSGAQSMKLMSDLKALKASGKGALVKSIEASNIALAFLAEGDYSPDFINYAHTALSGSGFAATAETIAAQGWALHAQKNANGQDDGPKEGDTKPGKNGMLILKNGHWVKAGPDEIPVPDFSTVVAGLTEEGKMFYANFADTVKKIFVDQETAKYITIHKDGTYSFKGIYPGMKKIGPDSPSLANKLAWEYINCLMKASNKKVHGNWDPMSVTYNSPLKKATPQNPANNGYIPPEAVEPKKSPDPTKASGTKAEPKVYGAGKPPVKTANWKVTGGNQGGSNEGLKMKDETGQEWYVKIPKNPEHAQAELLAAKLYAAGGFSAPDSMIVEHNGKVAIASKWVDLKKATPAQMKKAKGMLDGFAMDAWLGNWDVVGLNYDNAMLLPDGTIHRVDPGGSLMFRAMGEKKTADQWGPVVHELETFVNGTNDKTKDIFGKMKKADIEASVVKVLKISNAQISSLVHKFGPGDAAAKKELIKTLIARKEYLAEKFPAAKKAAIMASFDPNKITPPADFLNWSGPGKSGPSSIKAINEQNHAAAQKIYELAKAGDVAGIQSLTAPLVNKDTGAITGAASVLKHPSQHIAGYAAQALSEIESMLNPPAQYEMGGDNPLYDLANEYPVQSVSASAKKVGKYLLLGEPGTIDPASLGLTKLTHKSGKLTTDTFAKAAQQSWLKMPKTQQEAIRSYTGNSYHSINGGLWSGNPGAAAKAAASALLNNGHEITPGTVLGRKVSLSQEMIAELMGATGKILQEPAIMSTSISPDAWSGNVHLKMHVGPGVKGLYVDVGSKPGGGAISKNAGPAEREVILPPNTRMLVVKTTKGAGADADGFGKSSSVVIEVLILPSE